MNNFSRFHGKNILITGSTGGIGQAVAKRFVLEGGHVLLVDQEFDRLNAQTISLGKNASSFVCDVTNEVQCKHVNADILHHHSRIDIAILNAGIEGPIADLDTLTTADFDQVMAVNARGVFIWLSMLMKTMKKQSHGVITLTSSVAGLKGTAGLSPYVASKHAMMGLMKCAALEGAAHGIRVNAVNPGPIDTRMIQSIEAGFGDPNLVRQKYLSSIPLKRYGLADEIASTVAFLSSDEAGYSTGSGFVIDGGGQAGRSR